MLTKAPGFYAYFREKGGLTETDFSELIPYYTVRNVSRGELLLRRGEICQHALFTESGLLRLFFPDENGKEQVIQFAPEGWLITDRNTVYFNEPSDYAIDAIEDSTIVFIQPEFIQRASALSAPFRAYNERLLQNHIRHLQRRIRMLLGADAEHRYLDFIRLYPDLLLRVPQWMVASYLGITPESLSRVRKNLATRHTDSITSRNKR